MYDLSLGNKKSNVQYLEAIFNKEGNSEDEIKERINKGANLKLSGKKKHCTLFSFARVSTS